MEKDVLIALRKKLKMDKNIPLRIQSDELFIIDERCNLVMWDDSQGVLYAACPNQYRETQVAYPASLVAIAYENVVRVEAVYGSEDFDTLMTGFVNDGKTNQKSVDKITDMIFNLTDVNMYIPAKDRDPSVLKKVDVATGHTEDIEPYEEPKNKLEVNPVISDMSVLTNLDETYAAKQAAFQSQVKNTLKDPIKPAEDTSEKTTAHVPPRPGDPDYVAPEPEEDDNNSTVDVGAGEGSDVGDGPSLDDDEDEGLTEFEGSGQNATGFPTDPPSIPGFDTAEINPDTTEETEENNESGLDNGDTD